jgi:hypothetical protein
MQVVSLAHELQIITRYWIKTDISQRCEIKFQEEITKSSLKPNIILY